MNYRFSTIGLAVASLLISVSTSILAGDKTREQAVEEAFHTCTNIMAKANDQANPQLVLQVGSNCLVEMLRPHLKGASCVMFVAEMSRDPGFHCDGKGMLYYERLETSSSPSMTKQESLDAFKSILNKHVSKSIAICHLRTENKDELLSCLTRSKKRFSEVAKICAETRFAVENYAQMALAFDHCMEYKSRL